MEKSIAKYKIQKLMEAKARWKKLAEEGELDQKTLKKFLSATDKWIKKFEARLN